MSKKILILSASPRKGGNSETLCDQFAKGAHEAGHDAEKICLDEKHIGFCSACYACRKLDRCVKEDDMAMILGKMALADVIVLATPVYYYTMNAQMKAMIDRSLSGAKNIQNKEFYLIATAAAGKDKIERTIDGLRGYLECLAGAKEMGVIYGAGAWQLGDIQGNPAMSEAYEMGKNV